MKTLMIIPAAIATLGIGSNAINPNDLSAEQQTQVEFEADQEYYSNTFIQLPDSDPRTEIPEGLLSELNGAIKEDA